MSDKNLTTEHVRYGYSCSANNWVYLENTEKFDRWLAEHDRLVAGDAWQEGFNAGYSEAMDDAHGLSSDLLPGYPNPYRSEKQ